MIGAFLSVFRKSKVRRSIVSKIVYCLSVLLMLSISRVSSSYLTILDSNVEVNREQRSHQFFSKNKMAHLFVLASCFLSSAIFLAHIIKAVKN